jgi:hypothetical protein
LGAPPPPIFISCVFKKKKNVSANGQLHAPEPKGPSINAACSHVQSHLVFEDKIKKQLRLLYVDGGNTPSVTIECLLLAGIKKIT